MTKQVDSREKSSLGPGCR